MKSTRYDICMLAEYERAEKNMQNFCKLHYNENNTLCTDQEKKANSFYIAKDQCLTSAGAKRGKEYCQEQQKINPTNT